MKNKKIVFNKIIEEIEKRYPRTKYCNIIKNENKKIITIIDDCIFKDELIKNKLLNIKHQDKYRTVVESSISMKGGKLEEKISIIIYLLNNGFYNYCTKLNAFKYIFSEPIDINDICELKDNIFKNIMSLRISKNDLKIINSTKKINDEKKFLSNGLSASEPPKSASRALAKGLSASEPASAVSCARNGLNINDIALLIYEYYNHNGAGSMDIIIEEIQKKIILI